MRIYIQDQMKKEDHTIYIYIYTYHRERRTLKMRELEEGLELARGEDDDDDDEAAAEQRRGRLLINKKGRR